MFTKKLMLWMVAALVVFGAALTTVAYAQTGPVEDVAPPGETTSALDIVMSAGLIGLLIALISGVLVALIIEHFTSITDEKLIPPDFVAALQMSIDEKKFQDAMQLCEASDNYISRVMQVGLSEIRYGYDAMQEAMATIGEEESIKLNQKIGYLALIGTLGPMLGLLGTVLGMISCFKVISEAAVTNASALADGIYKALVTTVMGLLVGIPALFFHSFFQDKVTNVSLEAGAVCEELIRQFKPVKVTGAGPASAARAAAKPAARPAAPGGAAPQQPTA